MPLIRARPSVSAKVTGCAVAGPHLPLPHDCQRDVRQRGQIAGATQAAVLVDDRSQPRRQQVGVRLGGFAAHPGAPAGERRQPQQHHRAHDLAFDFGPRTRGVGTNEAALQGRTHVSRNVTGSQRTETGGHAVHRGGVGGQRFDVVAAGLDRLDCVVGELHGGGPAGDRDDVVEGDRTDTDGDCHLANRGLTAGRAEPSRYR